MTLDIKFYFLIKLIKIEFMLKMRKISAGGRGSSTILMSQVDKVYNVHPKHPFSYCSILIGFL